MDRIEPDDLPSQLKPRGEVASANEPRVESRRPTQLFRYIFFAVLVLVLSESALAWLFGRAST